MQIKSAPFLLFLLSLIYMVGVLGLSIPDFQPYFIRFTPVTLIISAMILFRFHKDRTRSFYLFLIGSFILSFVIEAIGVATGVIFGSYHYTTALGPQVFNTPVIIGINWVMLIYATGTVMDGVIKTKVAKAASGALLMVLFDLALEPVALSLQFWIWRDNGVPFRNYASWYIISFLLLWLFYSLPFKKDNQIAFYFLLIQLSFFIILSFTL